MRVTVTCAALVVSLLGSGQAQVPMTATIDYGALVREYMSGNADEAVARAITLERSTLVDTFKAFASTSPTAGVLTAAAAMHTEAGLRSAVDAAGPFVNRQVDVAAAIVQVGTPPRLKRLGSLDLRESALPPVSPRFRRHWYLTVITVMENGGRIDLAQAYLESARALFPRDPEILRLSGIGEEMRASNRLTILSADDRRKALGHAEVYLRGSLELAPDGLETRLRLGRVLALRDRAVEARPLLTTVSEAPDVRLAYLACLFLGALEDSAGNTAAAALWYGRAAARDPSAQSALIGASELQHRAGERREAAVSLASGIGAQKSDPWWAYLFGEYWRIETHLKELRRMGRS
jgi:tetratricopeptide (TPR) repeat protein